MASRIEIFTLTVPANTPILAPNVSTMTFDIGVADAVEIVVPAGPSGLVGWGILHSGESVYPREPDRWIIADNEVIHWPLDNAPTAGRWGLRAYNLDVFDHTLYFRWLVTEVWATAGPIPLVPIVAGA
jgi:hypothetical protein